MRRGILCALLGGVFWGFSANCAEVLMRFHGVPVEWITCARMTFAAAFFAVLCAVRFRAQVVAALRDRRTVVSLMLFSLLGVLFMQFSYLEAIRFAGAGTALLLQQLGLALIMLVLCVKQRRLPVLREALGLVCAFVGAFLISTQGDPSSLAIPAAGLAWGLASAVSLIFYNLLPVKPLARYGSFVVTGFAMSLSAVFSAAMFRPWSAGVSLSLDGWLVLAAIVVVGTIGAYILYIQGIKDAGPMRASLLGTVEPVSGMVISAVWLGTPISPFDIAGAVAIVVMIVLVTEREAPRREPLGESAV